MRMEKKNPAITAPRFTPPSLLKKSLFYLLGLGGCGVWRGVSLIWNMNFDFPATTHAIKAALIPSAARTDGIIWRLERFGGEEMVRVLATR